MTNEELETIKTKLSLARTQLRLTYNDNIQDALSNVEKSIAIIDDVQKRAVKFGRGPNCYDCNCKTRCERYAQR